MSRLMDSLRDWLYRTEDQLRQSVEGYPPSHRPAERYRPDRRDDQYMDPSAEAEYTDEALKALEEWKAAENYFNSIEDQDLVEYALYELEAARRKYEYLMRKLRHGDAAWERRSRPPAGYTGYRV